MAEEEDKPFFIDGHRLPIYQQLAAYFSNDYSYFRCGLDQQKGLLIFGGFGVGKSLMMRLFRVNTLQSFRIVGSRAIRDQYRTTGNYSDYTRAFQNKISAQYFGQANIGLCIDDAGAETVVSHYNNTANVIAEIIQDRYERPALRGPMTHIITNATTNELREAYGPRVYSRLRQLFNIIAFDETATDLRE